MIPPFDVIVKVMETLEEDGEGYIMANWDGVKQRLTYLINTVNNVTGKSDKNLTNCISTLINGYGDGSIGIRISDDGLGNVIISGVSFLDDGNGNVTTEV